MKDFFTNERVIKRIGKLEPNIDRIDYSTYLQNKDFSNIIVNRWVKIGLLEGLDEDMSKECAYCFERMAVYLMFTNANYTDEFFDAVSFAMIRRVLKEVGTFNGEFSAKEFYEYYYQNIEDAKKHAKEYYDKSMKEPKGEYDEEACAIAWLCDRLSEEIIVRKNKMYTTKDLQEELKKIENYQTNIGETQNESETIN